MLTRLCHDSSAPQARSEREKEHKYGTITLVETAFQKRGGASEHVHETKGISSANVRSITEATSRKRSGEREVDKTVWPLLDTGFSVRAIAAQTTISAGTVGRSRKRWAKARGVSGSDPETPEQNETEEHAL